MFAKIVDFFRDPRVFIPLGTLLGILIIAGGTWLIWRSWLISISVALAVALAVLIVVLLRTILSEEREEMLAGGLEPQGGRGGAQESVGAGPDGVRTAFARAMSDLKRSRLGDQGIYAIPWWITLGARGSGKTELIRNAGLDVPAEFSHGLTGGPTVACDFALTNQAVVIDTAGEFVDAGEKTPKEWQELLRLLARYRSAGPLEGVIVPISAPWLQKSQSADFEELGRSLRRRFNELTEALGFDIPIYIVVTQLDRIQGFSELAHVLPPARLREAFGWTNDRRDVGDAADAAVGGLEPLLTEIDLVLPELLMREPDPVARRSLYFFPNEMRQLFDGVRQVVSSAFAPSIYDEVPFLRGVYFTSSVRGGELVSSMAARHGQSWATSQPGPALARGGIFTSHLFREILAGDDQLAVQSGGVGRRTRRVVGGFAAAVAITCLIFSAVSFVTNYGLIDTLDKRAERVRSAPSSLEGLDLLRQSILEARSPEAALRVPFFEGMRLRAADRAAEVFLWAFEREYARPTKDRIEGVLRGSGHDAFEALAVLAMDVAWLNGKADEQKALRPNLVQYTAFESVARDRERFEQAYDAYTRWIPDGTRERTIRAEREQVVDSATDLLDLRRLERWGKAQESVQPPIRLADFGLAPGSGAADPEVLGVYTRRAWEGVVRDLVKAVEESGGASAESIRRFRTAYVERFDRSWRELLLATPMPQVPSATPFESPHLKLFERMADEVSLDLPREGEMPRWMQLVIELRKEAPAPPPSGDGQAAAPPASPWTSYRQALDQVSIDASAAEQSSERALDLARGLEDGSSFAQALALVEELIPLRGQTLETSTIRQILSMPIIDATASVLSAAMKEVDERYYSEIYSKFGGKLEGSELTALYQPGSGALSSFLENDLGPFFERGQPKTVLNQVVPPLSEEFLRWLDYAGSFQASLYPGTGASPEIAVRLEGVPSRVVGRTDLFVTRRDIELDCTSGSGPQIFEYREGTSVGTLAWRPDCQRVTLRIWARTQGEPSRELRPRKEWEGPLALPQFFRAARNLGDDRYQWDLSYDDAEIRIVYKMRSGKRIVGLAHRAPPRSLRRSAANEG